MVGGFWGSDVKCAKRPPQRSETYVKRSEEAGAIAEHGT